MIEVVHPGLLCLIVDEGRDGFAALGIAPSRALDRLAYRAASALVGCLGGPALEVLGTPLTLKFHAAAFCAVTGARVNLRIDGVPAPDWSSFPVAEGATLHIGSLREGLRYYVGISGLQEGIPFLGSVTTHLEGGFGGYAGRALRAGDTLSLRGNARYRPCRIPEPLIPRMAPPHRLRVLPAPESHRFDQGWLSSGEGESRFQVSPLLNRTGIRLSGACVKRLDDVPAEILSDGLLPGTVQIPPDGHPLLSLYERTLGGYPRAGIVIRGDLDRLAHLRPQDPVVFCSVTPWEAQTAWRDYREGQALLLAEIETQERTTS